MTEAEVPAPDLMFRESVSTATVSSTAMPLVGGGGEVISVR